ncbi:cobyric acid synthase CobQ [Terasakiispira papahanaumokuakeensis]|uniref:Cobyric acid synthase n=1 Tax=Terasakiispira papahanaumokuakeensis TaxID=197479 RepID=A0A1E2VC73_9GAMM|nr:cobyric acid synthase [Terasakiispira papahanaumokuakeensis]ODC04610.1 cobyric acid synthase CobQ [Terasakiispira papahanaumokuakeensis]
MTTVMIQGTTSDAGKSTVVTALCRWLARQGISVAPFKPQNMALNSAVTVDGGEIGRSTALQALACGVPAHSDMNPVLLKPQSERGSQVILRGQVYGHMDALDYHAFKAEARDTVMAAWHALQQRHDVIVAEGAGSPAEINLRQNDIANMGFAEAADCDVLLVGDIERGGVFAQLYGTLALLSATEQARTQGFIINRFRGDPALLTSGLDWLSTQTGKPVFGVMPYLHDLLVDAEDSVGLTGSTARVSPGGLNRRSLNIVVPRLPRLSNHNDVDPLRLHPDVNLHWVGQGEAIPPADVIILPGSKSTRQDLDWLVRQGWPEVIRRHLRYGGHLLGICGGFQMLGTTIDDPSGLEGPAGRSQGLGWLQMTTRLVPGKQLRNVQGQLCFPERVTATGYEIHNGITEGPALARPFLQRDEAIGGASVSDGAVSDDGQIMGGYWHGLLESPTACQALLKHWGLRTDHRPVDYAQHRQQQLDRLADQLVSALDPAALHQLFKL